MKTTLNRVWKAIFGQAPGVGESETNSKDRRIAMVDVRRLGTVSCVFAALLVFAVSVGCLAGRTGTKSSKATEPESAPRKRGPVPLYYDFEDVLVPAELKVDRKRSFVYHSPDFTAGVLVLNGRVEVNSLIKFFDNNMAKDNWRLVSSFKSPRTVMFFNKANRGCIINVTEKQFGTEVEIWVAPYFEPTESGLLK